MTLNMALGNSNSVFDQKEGLFGLYVHIPYCLQRCTYCDFATYVHTEILPPEHYVELLKKEIQFGHTPFLGQTVHTLYFGGGTPSLIKAELIIDIINEFKKYFTFDPSIEITIEINPATVDERKLDLYLKNGVNRFSVGAQTFSDKHLKNVHREHNAQQTLNTLALLQSKKLNCSFDILFALPHQTVDELKYDLDIALDLGMSHISPYCLTVPEGHPLSKNRPLEDDQIEMFDLIDRRLAAKNFLRYEISNYAKPGFESKHNLLYWTDQSYWGVGLSAHSYNNKKWGTRFWNPHVMKNYEKYDFSQPRKNDLFEDLAPYQSLTDFCHTGLRLTQGLSRNHVQAKFGRNGLVIVDAIAKKLIPRGVIEHYEDRYKLTKTGLLISNQVFEEFTFLKDDFSDNF